MKIGIDYIGVTTPFYCIDGEGHLFLAKRSKKARDENGAWDPGGGQVEHGESLEEAVLREVKEEYGVNGKIIEQVPAHSVIRIQKGKKTHWLATPFIVLVDPKKLEIKETHKFDDSGWFTLSALPYPLHTAFERYVVNSALIEILKKYVKD